MHFQRNFIYQKSSYQNHIYIGRFHTLGSYSAYSKAQGTKVIRRKKKLIFLIWLIWSKQNKSHSSIGYQPYCDLFYILVICSFFEINFFLHTTYFFLHLIPGYIGQINLYLEKCPVLHSDL